MLAWKHQLFLEDRLEIAGIDAWNARFRNKLIQNTVGLVIRVSVFNVYSNLLLKKFLPVACKFHLHGNATVRGYSPSCWCDRPLANLKRILWLTFATFSSLFCIFLNFFGLFLGPFFISAPSTWRRQCICSLEFCFSILLQIFQQLFPKFLISIIKNGKIEFEKSLIFDLENSGLTLIELNGPKIHILQRHYRIIAKD